MSKRSRKGRAMRRRHYGHFGFKEIHDSTAGVRKIFSDNPAAAAAIVGGTVAAVAAGLPPAHAALAGAAAGVAVQQASRT